MLSVNSLLRTASSCSVTRWHCTAQRPASPFVSGPLSMWLMLYMQYSSYHIPIKFPIFFPKSTSLIFFFQRSRMKKLLRLHSYSSCISGQAKMDTQSPDLFLSTIIINSILFFLLPACFCMQLWSLPFSSHTTQQPPVWELLPRHPAVQHSNTPGAKQKATRCCTGCSEAGHPWPSQSNTLSIHARDWVRALRCESCWKPRLNLICT